MAPPPNDKGFAHVLAPERRQTEERPESLTRPENIQQLLDRAYFAKT